MSFGFNVMDLIVCFSIILSRHPNKKDETKLGQVFTKHNWMHDNCRSEWYKTKTANGVAGYGDRKMQRAVGVSVIKKNLNCQKSFIHTVKAT